MPDIANMLDRWLVLYHGVMNSNNSFTIFKGCYHFYDIMLVADTVDKRFSVHVRGLFVNY